MSLNTAALRYWTASRTLLNPSLADDDGIIVRAAVDLALMAERSSPALARRINRSIDIANDRGLFAEADDEFVALEA